MFGVLMMHILLLILYFITGLIALTKGSIGISAMLAFIMCLQVALTFQIQNLYEKEKAKKQQ